MQGFLARDRSRAAITTALLVWSVAGAGAGGPQRVVSMNVCTDQLAMLIAAPGQLYSVSYLASQPSASVLAAQAAAYRTNHGLAEEIFLMQPDLVLAGSFTTRATVSMLQRLGFPVAEFVPETSFDDVRANIRRMGAILDRAPKADELIAELGAGLDRLQRTAQPDQVAATYSANSYTAGSGSLTAAVIEAAGLQNLGTRLGISGTGRLPLELLVLSDVDIVVAGTQGYAAPALAQQNFVHPAYRAVVEQRKTALVPEPNWICGGPFTLVAAEILQDAARRAAPNAAGSVR